MTLPLFGLTLVACLCLVHGQTTPPGEKRLARCKRPLCEVYCPGGFQVDEGGCETCKCQMPCAEPMCANDCRQLGGYKHNEWGCMTCECKELLTCEDMECSSGQLCRPDFSHCTPGMTGECLPMPLCVDIDQRPGPRPDCPMRKCPAVICEYGLKRDENGCPTCSCASDPCETHECHEGQQCQLEKIAGCEGITCPVVASCTFKSLCHLRRSVMERMRERRGHMPGMMPPPPREVMEELRDGPMGDMMEDGPMGDMMDGPMGDMMDGPMGDMMDGPMGDMMGGPMMDYLKHKGMGFFPKCDSNGNFHPKQCSEDRMNPECWCVDDRGVEVEGTRKKLMVGDHAAAQCERNHTEAMDLKFHVMHEFDDINPHLDDLKSAVRQHLSRWLTIEERYIVVVKIEPDSHRMQLVLIHVVVMPDGVTDLPSAAYHLHDQMRKKNCNIAFKGQNMRTDPNTLHVNHRYALPQLPREGVDFHRKSDGISIPVRGSMEYVEEDEDDDEEGGVVSFCRAHRAAVLIGCVGGAIILLCLAVVIISILRKKGRASHQFEHQRFDNYKKNLALAGEIMKHPDDLTPEKEPTVAVISVTDTDTDRDASSVA